MLIKFTEKHLSSMTKHKFFSENIFSSLDYA